MQGAGSGDSLTRTPGPGAIEPMPEADIGKAVQLLDRMLEFSGMMATGRAAVMTTETAATVSSALFCIWAASIACRRRRRSRSSRMRCPAPAFPSFTSTIIRCGSLAELRSVIVKARRSGA